MTLYDRDDDRPPEGTEETAFYKRRIGVTETRTEKRDLFADCGDAGRAAQRAVKQCRRRDHKQLVNVRLLAVAATALLLRRPCGRRPTHS